MIAAGTKLGVYELIVPLGSGGMGEVYRARDIRLGRDVALKVLPPHLAADPSSLARFEQEARHVAALNHPNIVAVFDIGSQDGVAYIVSELVDGQIIFAIIRDSDAGDDDRRRVAWLRTRPAGYASRVQQKP
jgi:eukaryotic-like serine/threonine-protein kinase